MLETLGNGPYNGLLNGKPTLDPLDSPRNSFHVFDFSDSTIWLLLALTVLFWQVAGTIVGTVLPLTFSEPAAPNPMIDDRSADSERVVEEVTHRR